MRLHASVWERILAPSDPAPRPSPDISHGQMQTLRTLGRKVARSVLPYTAIPELLLRQRARRHITIITYHRIGTPPGDYPFDGNVFSATSDEFEREVRYLARHVDLLSIDELAAALRGAAPLPQRPAVITFDDGYEDNYRVAFPVLRALAIPACFFLVTSWVGTAHLPWWDEVACCFKHSSKRVIPSPFPDDPEPFQLEEPYRTRTVRRYLRGLKELPWDQVPTYIDALRDQSDVCAGSFAEKERFVSWHDARSMQRAGMSIGGHTRSHPVLGKIEDPSRLQHEIQGCYEDITKEIGVAPTAFAYPVGHPSAMSTEADEIIRKSGFSLIFSHTSQLTRRSQDSPRLGRMPLDYGDDHAAFRLGIMRGSSTPAFESV